MRSVIHVILSGGVGSRLWPLSRKSCPKQYLKLFKNKSLFELTADRNLSLIDQLIVVGNKDNNEFNNAYLKEFPKECKIIVEALPKNTAAAIAFASFSVEEKTLLLITPSDHVIGENEKYSNAINRALELADSGSIVTFGIKPSRPETGFGYIEYDGEEVKSFHEKPDLVTAESFLREGGFLWNSGMFCFQAGVYLAELKKYAPEVYQTSLEVWKNSNDGILDEVLTKNIPSISVDYAVMEKSDKIKVVASDFEWSDLGSFESLYDYLVKMDYPVDDYGNMVIGNCDKHVSFIGLENTILAYTEDAILILDKEKSQDVKKVYNKLEIENPKLL